MSTQAAPNLESVVSERGHAYVVTVSEHGAPHAVYAPVRWEGGGLVAEVGAHPDPASSCGADCVPLSLLIMPTRR
jgi:hypothetical protein